MGGVKDRDALAGVGRSDSRCQDVWDALDRYADRWDKKGNLLEEGRPRPSRANLNLILNFDPRLEGTLRYNEFTGRVEFQGEVIQDHHETRIATWLSETYQVEFTKRMLGPGLDMVARETAYHPVRDYLTKLEWDGVSRLPTWLHRYTGADDSVLNAHIGTCWAVSAVARILRPGCKVDTVLTLVGEQGRSKSKLFRLLAVDPAWFSDAVVHLSNALKSADAAMVLQGRWVFEFAELEAVRSGSQARVKQYVTTQVDNYRPPYGSHYVDWPRQCVFVGTVNKQEFLGDPTGSRRFWPVAVNRLDLDAIVADRDQLWAEAVVRFRQGEQWWLPDEVEALRHVNADRYTSADAWTDDVAAFLQNRSMTTVQEVLTKAVKMELGRVNRSHQMRAAGILESLGWVKGKRRRFHGRLIRPWYPPKYSPDTGHLS